ncbi:fumarylacetoacetate hydrolase family protein [Marinomonas sp. 15G1-11]|uniref:Fumarylacetoacetate hydrolase family protein n=1 Tax=Marinomonas phaeophyticola TaxID=3004091 RepID=A0ABT4JQF0_9GAMM|nr:fumarylacetoacetate hydrolase family protein [Marinomonas sp. 15G1-11]MCZ2720590.1 fumarylacetoacetate hydrolase family protein [Marinomonas sp. 15G1-11]
MKKQNFIFPPKEVVSLSIFESDQAFPVNRIFCVGRNYAEHAREMGDDPDRDPPFFFCKDVSSVLEVPFSGLSSIPYPAGTERYEYEAELVVALSKGGKDISKSDALDFIFGYSIGLDMTRRDLQTQAKKKGRPWEVGKSFELSAPLTPIKTTQQVGLLDEGLIELKVDGVVRQSSNLSNLTWSVAEIISHLSKVFELHPGDLIMTGTPENVGPVDIGETMQVFIEGLGGFDLKVMP